MKGFPGFPEGKVPSVPLPEPFFTDLLPDLDHLGELKTTLYAFWRLSRKPGPYRYLSRTDFLADERFLRGLSPVPRQAEERLDEALERAEARGTFLHVRLEDDQAVHDLYFLNSAKGREALEQLSHGAWRPAEAGAGTVITLSQMRSRLFVQYEQNIGPLTPMVAEELREAEATYPAAWIEEAIRIAVKNNARSLKYVQAVLRRMQTEGRHEREDREDPEEILRRYAGYRPFIEDE